MKNVSADERKALHKFYREADKFKCKLMTVRYDTQPPDKYGRCIKARCISCQLETTWHTEQYKAQQALYDLHQDKFKGALSCKCCHGGGTVIQKTGETEEILDINDNVSYIDLTIRVECPRCHGIGVERNDQNAEYWDGLLAERKEKHESSMSK